MADKTKEFPRNDTCLPWRVGTKVGRTIYCHNTLIGVMDKIGDAAYVVAAANEIYDLQRENERLTRENKIFREVLEQLRTVVDELEK